MATETEILCTNCGARNYLAVQCWGCGQVVRLIPSNIAPPEIRSGEWMDGYDERRAEGQLKYNEWEKDRPCTPSDFPSEEEAYLAGYEEGRRAESEKPSIIAHQRQPDL